MVLSARARGATSDSSQSQAVELVLNDHSHRCHLCQRCCHKESEDPGDEVQPDCSLPIHCQSVVPAILEYRERFTALPPLSKENVLVLCPFRSPSSPHTTTNRHLREHRFPRRHDDTSQAQDGK